MFNTDPNLILNTDSYKASHYLQYPAGTRYVSSYIEARGGRFKEALFFGLQAFLKEYLTKPITQAHIDEAEAILSAHGVPFNREGWDYILQQHGGYFPLDIEALPEGCIVPTGTALAQVVNTDANVPWLTSYVETALLRAVWYPTTVATLSWQIKQVIKRALAETSDTDIKASGLAFKLHDFGARGVSSYESAGLGGMAHLVNFSGTDTVAALLAARRYYQADMPAFSIPAAEHSTITAWGKDAEAEAYANMLKQFAQRGKILAVVSDSYDIYRAVSEIWGKQLKAEVENSGATLVVRPDSGDPATVVVEVLERLYACFGGHVNDKGYRVLPDCVRVIQGDGIALASIQKILDDMKAHGFAADNIAFGMGGALLQKPDRDTLSFAMKASAIQIEEHWRDVFKAPVTDSKKSSKKGRLAVVAEANRVATVRWDELQGRENLLRSVYRDGELLVDDDFALVRERAMAYSVSAIFKS